MTGIHEVTGSIPVWSTNLRSRTLNIGNLRAWLLIIGMMLAPMIAARLLF
jgi:hypothetical protein